MDGIKSRDRVKEHGEVFTPDSIVNDMLDLTDIRLKGVDENNNIIELKTTEDIKKYIDTTYLEPACGNGNFLIRILDRKLEAVQKLPENEQELWLIHAVAAIYGVDIQDDNVKESKERMLELIKTGSISVLDLDYKETKPWHFKPIQLRPEIENVLKFIMDKNIKLGNALTGFHVNGNHEDIAEEPMLFAEYKWNNYKVTCSGHTLQDIEQQSEVDRFENNGREVDIIDIESLNFSYNDDAGDDF